MISSHPLGNNIEFHPSLRESQRLEFNLARTSLNLHLTIILFGTIYGFLSKISFLQIIPDLPSRFFLHAPCPMPTVFKVGLFFPLPPSLCCVIQYTHFSLAPFTSMNTLAAHALVIYWNYILVDHLAHRVKKGRMACSTTNGARS